ncbi:MAG: radical SAM family heme chaperone HemW [Rhodobacteraceae bacterium]|jgi:oxygen-independent coproporphyrinogen-3 oxidase|nr:radical SAM family heme chaperone HemW [Paracoccaceae bacterium]
MRLPAPDLADDWQAAGFGIYLHWPYCAAKCPYCDFNSHVAARIDHARWMSAYLSEIEHYFVQTGPRVLRSVFFGGGTPSLMDPDTVAGVIAAIRSRWPAANDLEITLEANPGSVEAGRFRAFREAGVNRVSLGLQALDDTDLKRLGRIHSVDEGLAALEVARATFDRVSFDLIYARQNQTLDHWRDELRRALAMGPDHLSLYQLTVEPGTAFADRLARGGLRGLPDEDRAADLWDLTQDMTAAAGLPAYETSNHARPGAESVHNRIYWQSGDWLGIGPGAHGRLTLHGQRHATEAIRAPEAWLDAVERQGSGEMVQTVLDPTDRAEEFLMMGLRLSDGIDLARWARLSDNRSLPYRGLLEDGLVEVRDDRLQLTAAGRPVLNAVLRALLTPSR